MRILHVVLPGASEYEKKSQRIDFEALRIEHQIVDAGTADVMQIYGPPSRIGKVVVSPLTNLPEAVEEKFFSERGGLPPLSRPKVIGSYLRPSILRMVERAVPRLHRTRDDIEWHLLDRPPLPEDFAQFD